MPNMSERGVNLEQGEVITLFASAVRTATAGVNGTAVAILGERRRYIFILDVTAAATEGTDTLDVYIDWSIDNVTYYNGGHFTQVLGNGGAVSFYMVFDPTTPGVADIDVTADQAASTVVPSLFGPYVRGRYVEVDGGGVASSFTFSLIGYAL
jgi:hypothetical protein